MCMLKRAQPAQQVDPVVRPIFAGMPADQGYLRVERIPDVRRHIDHAGPRPPQANCRTKSIALTPQKNRTEPQRQGHLKQAATEDGHKFAQRNEKYMSGFMDQYHDIVHERAHQLSIAVIRPGQPNSPDCHKHQRSSPTIETD